MIPLIGQKPQLPPTVILGGHVPGTDKLWLQYAPVGTISIEEAERMIQGLQAAVEMAKAVRAAAQAVVEGNGAVNPV